MNNDPIHTNKFRLAIGLIACIIVGIAVGTALQDFLLQKVEARTGIGLAKTAVIQSEYRPITGSYSRLAVVSGTPVFLDGTAATGTPSIPTGAYLAYIQAEDGNIRYQDDGGTPVGATPTGMLLSIGGERWYQGDLESLVVDAEAGTVHLNVLFYGK